MASRSPFEQDDEVPNLIEDKSYSAAGTPVAMMQMANPTVSRDRNTVSFAPITSALPYLNMNTIHISCSSDRFDPYGNFVGMIVYGYNGQSDFYLNGRHCRAGYMLIKNVNSINRIPADTMHKKLFKCFFGIDLPSEFSGGGFAYQNGTWKHNSFSFNINADLYHDTQKGMHQIEQQLVNAALNRLYINDQWFYSPNLPVKEIFSRNTRPIYSDQSSQFTNIVQYHW
ncbi:unnamed protein product [Rotaria magnacalcarata]|uniref:Uncharacterized protein n=1 Tax=Rotaria magnacalcarata TaxID=392030 RepID=A0A817APY6_9BILA|nr:unnamed protein product [Rotaria magnacalcarata]